MGYFYQKVLVLKPSWKAVNKAERKMKSLILKACFYEDCSYVSASFFFLLLLLFFFLMRQFRHYGQFLFFLLKMGIRKEE